MPFTSFEKKLLAASVACLGVSVASVCTAFKACDHARLYEQKAESLYTRARAAELDLTKLREQLSTKNLGQPENVMLVGASGTLARSNKNPANVKKLPAGQKWKGQIGIDRHGHVIFSDWQYGVRAAAMVLTAYSKRHGINTIKGIVERFSTSNHAAYIAFLCKRMHLKADEKFSIQKRMPELIRYMVAFESGKPMDKKHFAALDVLAAL